MIPKVSAVTLAACLCIPSPAQAEDGFYIGLGAGASNARSSERFGGTGTDTFGLVGVTLGYRRDGARMFFGGEIDADLSFGSDLRSWSGTPCAIYADGPYYCSHQATVRLRGIVGMPVGDDLEGFATLGLVAVRGESAVGPDFQAENTNTGFTIGLGVQKALASGRMLRGEVIHDRADTSQTRPVSIYSGPAGFNPDFRAVSVKVTLIF